MYIFGQANYDALIKAISGKYKQEEESFRPDIIIKNKTKGQKLSEKAFKAFKKI